MERPINEKFVDNGRKLTVVPGESCLWCVYKGAVIPRCHKIGDIAGVCYSGLRSDETSVIFVDSLKE